ncbi:uncharacterized protein LOC128232595 [Mya arenaria]|uniref:uncharacterized protein LOC128232595 n=1 Tax=Mya arenaria TaxID=6604 RepID=UPI0022E01169|nr:uncharacterized protein LOC128232595 [Mya arenaria]
MSYANAQQIQAVHQEVLEVNSTTKFVLKRVNELSNALQNNHCSPACAKFKKEILEEIGVLSESVDELNKQEVKRSTQYEDERRIREEETRIQEEERRNKDEERRVRESIMQDEIDQLKQTVEEFRTNLNRMIANGHPVLETKHDKPSIRSTGKELVLKRNQTVAHVPTRGSSTNQSSRSLMSQNYDRNDRGLQPARETRLNFSRRPQSQGNETIASTNPSSLKQLTWDETSNESSKVDESTAEEKAFFGTNEVWIVEAKNELHTSQAEVGSLEGVFTILLVDTSSSMRQDGAWNETSTFVHDYLAGLQRMASEQGCEEYVALVTFGKVTGCIQRFTQSYEKILQAFEKIKPGGPSPLYGGLLLAQAIFLSPADTLPSLTNGLMVHPKLILITDGYPTESCLYRGPDATVANIAPETLQDILAATEHAVRSTDGPVADMFILPVGRANREFIKVLLGDAIFGKILHFRDGQSFSRRLMLTGKILPELFSDPFLMSLLRHDPTRFYRDRIPVDDPSITRLDTEQMLEIIDMDQKRRLAKANEVNPYNEEPDGTFPRIGSRVRRGPDWDKEDQDGEGPGTVVGHRKEFGGNVVFVNWDASGKVFQYEYGHRDRYGVWPVNEPRRLHPGQPLDVGCYVTPAKDWSGDAAIVGQKGVVLLVRRKETIRMVVVRWNIGSIGEYSYGEDKRFEVKMCEPCELQPLGERQRPLRNQPLTQRQRAGENQPPAIKPSKNKNKNK